VQSAYSLDVALPPRETMCRRTLLDADGVVLDADSATSDADSDDSQPKKAPDGSAVELPPEELWQVHGAYYNLESFAKHHPGGVEQIIAQKGKDCTTLFETVHLFDEQPRKVLRKYYVRDVPDYEPTLVWSGDDFYPTLKRRVKAHFRKVHKEEKHRLYARTHPNLVHHGTPAYHAAMCFFLMGTYVLYVGALAYDSAFCAVLWGLFAFASGGVGHESLHAGTFTTPRRNRIACWFLLDTSNPYPTPTPTPNPNPNPNPNSTPSHDPGPNPSPTLNQVLPRHVRYLELHVPARAHLRPSPAHERARGRP
jgi:cytochrome b involved in lipid metabolism